MYKILSKFMVVILTLGLIMSAFSSKVFADEKRLPSGIEYSKLKDTIDGYAKEYINNTTAGAAVEVLQNDEIVFKANYGYSDIKNKTSVSDNTIFEWGSTSKLLVWVSAIQLVEQGKLDLNKDIKAYLPENFFHKLKYVQPITMLNLMNHNAGFEEHYPICVNL